ncbi:MAG: hypothetical protein A2475_07550 [Ignavibacteria bacterium RIFOXYC2_FULL_35_21]|nr:MAG: hypothetical protein A2X63_09795 [Ignavibacteria bacterium GWA2_35_8]OGU96430.1 MAG: hypothetical protein A2220_07700 [Ignavibacteria bacterium RIFOXYA2_FULL_35_10]OGV18593.1 MAG: hypothetical protein A2475_07550 [Ignavibacteria bacterium RIFOXYC2_FULL_35_21]
MDLFVNIKSINPNDTNFSDLEPLKKILKDVDIVMLGEQSHGDGSTYEAKTRLIKFLHQEMGFDVLAFENIMFDGNKVWQEIKKGKDPLQSSQKGINKLWSSSKQCIPLFKYISSKKNTFHPLILTGIDNRTTSMFMRNYFLKDFETFLKPLDKKFIKGSVWKNFLNLFVKFPLYYSPEQNKDSILNFAKTYKRHLNLIKDKLKSLIHKNSDQTDNINFWIQQINGLNAWTDGLINKDDPYIPGIIRDSIMAENIIFLKNNYYKNHKIIVWAATAHLIKDSKGIDFESYNKNNIKRVGEYISEYYKNKVYVVGFTSAVGKMLNFVYQNVTDLSNPSKGSIEDILQSLNKEYLFIDFRNKNIKDIFDRNLNSKCLGNIELQNNWTKSLDGIFYIKTLEPSELY